MSDRGGRDGGVGPVVTRREALRITAGVGIGAAFGLGLGAEALRRARLHRVADTRTRMGTLVTLTVVHPDRSTADVMLTRAFEEMTRLEAVLSRYRPDSAVGRLNEAGHLTRAPIELLDVLGLSHGVGEASGGAFDVTIGPLVELHRRAFLETGLPPTDGAVRAALELVGQDGLLVADDRVWFADKRMSISLDGVAKGYIVDRTVDRLSRDGAERVLVDAGGDMASEGEALARDPWTVGVQHPRTAGALIGRMALAGGGVATSGDYLRNFTADRRHHDTLDPRTGRSPDAASATTVLAPSAAEADALSTAALVLGPAEGVAMIDAYPGAEALVVSKDGDPVMSGGMARRLG